MTNHYNRQRKGQTVIHHMEGIVVANSKYTILTFWTKLLAIMIRVM